MTRQTVEKEVLQLWQDYLKHSEVYRRFCEFWDKRIFEDQNTPIPQEFDDSGINSHKIFGCISNYRRFNNLFIDFKLQEQKKKKLWKKGAPLRKALGINKLPAPIERGPVVENYADIVEEDINFAIEFLKSKYGREPNLQEFKVFFMECIKDYPDLLHLRVSPFNPRPSDRSGYIKSLEKEFSNFIKNKVLKKPASSTRIRLDELKRYLSVYELRKKGLKWKDVVKKIGKNKVFTDDVRRAFVADHEKAKKIIENAERGVFPGRY